MKITSIKTSLTFLLLSFVLNDFVFAQLGKPQPECPVNANKAKLDNCMTFKDDYYQGEWKNGSRNGYGIKLYDGKKRYEGYFLDNMYEGYGVLYDRWGEKIVSSGIWKNGELIYSMPIDRSKFKYGLPENSPERLGVIPKYLGKAAEATLPSEAEEDVICKKNGIKPKTPAFVECKIKVRIALDEKKRLEIDHQNKLEQDRLAKVEYEKKLEERKAAKERQDLIMQEKQVERQKECATRQMICGLDKLARRHNRDCDAAYDRCVAGVLEPPEPPPPPRPPNYHCQPIPGQIPDPVSGAVPMDCRSY